MPSLKLVEESESRLVYNMGAFSMVLQMGLFIFISAAVSASLTLFLRHYVGIFAFIFVAGPGLLCVICGCFGCANARSFVFSFDLSTGIFSASAGGLALERPLTEVRLVHIERELQNGGFLGGDSGPSFAAVLLFADGYRLRLESGISITGSGRGPESLHVQAEKIAQFLRLPQIQVPILDISQEAAQEKMSEDESQTWLSRWLACQGLAPRLSPPLYQYDWMEPPQGAVVLPPPALRPSGRNVPYNGGGWAPGGGMPIHSAMRQSNQWNCPTVVGRVHQPAARSMEVAVPPGMSGQSLAVMAPDGSQVMVTVPANMRPGEVMTIQY